MKQSSGNFILNEENMMEVGQTINKNGEKLERMVSQYLAEILRVRVVAILQGELSNEFESYIDYAKVMRNQITTMSERYRDLCTHLVDEVDKRDQYLF